jgi:hypothetical protein
MNSHLFGRALGTISPQAVQRAATTQLLRAIEAAPRVLFDGSAASSGPDGISRGNASSEILAHRAGVNCLVVEKFEGR